MTLGEEDFGVLMKILVENIGEGSKEQKRVLRSQGSQGTPRPLPSPPPPLFYHASVASRSALVLSMLHVVQRLHALYRLLFLLLSHLNWILDSSVTRRPVRFWSSVTGPRTTSQSSACRSNVSVVTVS